MASHSLPGVMVGEFMAVGTSERLVDELVRQHKSQLNVICNDAGGLGKGVGKLLDVALVSTLNASHIGLNPKAQQQMLAKQIVIDLVPQGTLVSASAPAAAVLEACSRRPAWDD